MAEIKFAVELECNEDTNDFYIIDRNNNDKRLVHVHAEKYPNTRNEWSLIAKLFNDNFYTIAETLITTDDISSASFWITGIKARKGKLLIEFNNYSTSEIVVRSMGIINNSYYTEYIN